MTETPEAPKRRGRPKKAATETATTPTPRKRRKTTKADKGVVVADVKKVTKFLEKNGLTTTDLRGILDLMDTVTGA